MRLGSALLVVALVLPACTDDTRAPGNASQSAGGSASIGAREDNAAAAPTAGSSGNTEAPGDADGSGGAGDSGDAEGIGGADASSGAGDGGGASGSGSMGDLSGTGGIGGAGDTGGAAGSIGAADSGGSGGSSGMSGAGGAGGKGDGQAGAGGGSDVLPVATWDWNGVVGSGQSLSVGARASAVISTTQPYDNKMLSLGNLVVPPYDDSSAELSLVPLIEPTRAPVSDYPSPYPDNIRGETPHSAMGNQVTALARASGADYLSVHSVIGEDGQPMSVIQKGATDTGDTGRSYEAALFEVTAIARLAQAAGATYGIGAVVLTHGESDAESSSYGEELVEFWADYNTDLKALTGQAQPILMLLSQQHSVPEEAGTRAASTQAQWRVGVEHPAEISCTGPKYQYPYVADAVHLTATGYAQLGEKYGQVYFERVVLGHAWQPLQPTAVTRSGRVVSVEFHVPVPPLVFGTSMPDPHQSGITEWSEGRGFELRSGDSNIAIESVEVSGDSVNITAASDLPASSLVVGYAVSANPGKYPDGTIRWGNLQDSDPFVGSTTGLGQPNYAVAFELPVP